MKYFILKNFTLKKKLKTPPFGKYFNRMHKKEKSLNVLESFYITIYNTYVSKIHHCHHQHRQHRSLATGKKQQAWVTVPILSF